jgi:MraZ protein
VFLGEYQHSLDSKGRVVLPRKFRDDLEGGCVVTKGQEHCLYLFTMEAWRDEVARLSRLPRTDGRARKLTRSFFAAASDQTLDKQGRIQLSDGLRGYASLEKDVTIVGVADRVEIWSTPIWESVSLEADDFYAEIEEVLSEGSGI